MRAPVSYTHLDVYKRQLYPPGRMTIPPSSKLCPPFLAEGEVVILTKIRIPTILSLWVGDLVVAETNTVTKYLWVLFDKKMSFFHQMRDTAEKTQQIDV